MECYINKIPIYYEEYGVGKPILCLHGFPEDHRVMAGCIEPVLQDMKGYRRIYLDLPGMGKTSAMPNINNADDMLDLIRSFVDKIIGNENFLVIGQSYGGYLSLGLLYHMQQEIDGVFLFCPCVIADKQNRTLPDKQIVSEDQNLIHSNSASTDFIDYMDYGVIITTETWDRYKKEVLPGLQIADPVFVEKYQKQGYCFTFESEIGKVSYNKPACIITGKQDNCVGYKNALDLINCFTRATFSVMDAAGHNLQIERTKLFNAHLLDWLDRT